MTLPIGTTLPHPCPECGSEMKLRDSKYGLFYACVAWPACRTTHGAHKSSGKPLGVPADAATRKARMAAHAAFDQMWQGPRAAYDRRGAYRWLREQLGISKEECHIGRFDIATCERVAALCRPLPGPLPEEDPEGFGEWP